MELVFALYDADLVFVLRELVPEALRLFAQVEAVAAGLEAVYPGRRRVPRTVFQDLGVVAVGVLVVSLLPVRGLALGVAEGALVLSGAVQEAPNFGAGLGRGPTALRAVRAIARGIVPEGTRRVRRRRRWRMLRRRRDLR